MRNSCCKRLNKCFFKIYVTLNMYLLNEWRHCYYYYYYYYSYFYYYHLTSIIIIILLLLLLLLLKLSHDMYKQYHNLCLLPLITATCTWVLMTSPAVCFLDHSSSKASSVLLISMSSIVAGQNTATVPSLSSAVSYTHLTLPTNREV